MRQDLTMADLPPMSQEEKEWWEEHNPEYYHYFYRIDNMNNGKFYYGIHSQRIDSGKKPEDDGYMGSGIELKKAQNEEGIENFKKTVVKTFSTRDEARLEEMMIVDEDIIEDPMCYNLALGGGCVPSFLTPTEGLVIVNYRDEAKKKDKMFLVPADEYQNNKDLYITTSSGKVVVNYRDPKKRKDRAFQVSQEEYVQHRDEYIVSSSGKSIYRNAKDPSDIRLLDTDDPLVVSGEYVAIAKGRKQSADEIKRKTGTGNGMYGKMWITDGKASKIIAENSTVPPGWRKGRVMCRKVCGEPTKAVPKVCLINRYTKEERWVTRNGHGDLDKDVWFSPGFFKDGEFIEYDVLQRLFSETNSWTKVSKLLGVSLESVRKIRDYYISLGKSFSSEAIIRKPREIGKWSSGMKDRVYIHNENGYKTVKRNELGQYLSSGWILGKKNK